MSFVEYLYYMTPFDSGLYKTLHLLVMLWRVNKQQKSKSLPEQSATVRISRQILTDAGLTVPELSNYLNWMADRHYLNGVVVYDDSYRKRLKKQMNSEEGKELNESLEKFDREDKTGKANKMVVEHFKAQLPPDKELDEEAIEAESIGFSELSSAGYELIKNLQSDEIALIVLSPFRDIDRLLELVGDGEDPKKIKDEGTWYDTKNCIFHVGQDTISTSHQGKPNNEHYVLLHFENAKKTGKIWFDEIDGFRRESLRRSMYRFIEKDLRLTGMFSVHSDRIEVFTGQI
jgi:hypothetical protein